MPCRWFLHPPSSCSQPSMVLLCRAVNTTQSLISFHCSSQQPPAAASSLLTLLLLHSLCFISALRLPSSAPWWLHPACSSWHSQKVPSCWYPQPPLWKGYDIQVYKTANRQTKQTPSITGGFASLSRAQIGKSISWLSKWGFQSVLFKLSVGTSRNQSMPLSTTQMGHKLTCLSPTTSHIF